MENHHLQWVFPVKMVTFHSYASLLEGNLVDTFRYERLFVPVKFGYIHIPGVGDSWITNAESVIEYHKYTAQKKLFNILLI